MKSIPTLIYDSTFGSSFESRDFVIVEFLINMRSDLLKRFPKWGPEDHQGSSEQNREYNLSFFGGEITYMEKVIK